MSMKRLGERTRALVFPSPPLKFRTSGFPQYGFKRGVERDLRPRTYTHPKPMVMISMAANGMYDEISRYGIPVQRPLARQRVMLSPRVVAYYGLIRASRGLLSTYDFDDRSLLPPVARGSPIYSACPFHRAAPGPRRTERSHATVASPPAVAFAVFASARHPQSRAYRYERGVSRG
jgi:hypothetical protein